MTLEEAYPGARNLVAATEILRRDHGDWWNNTYIKDRQEEVSETGMADWFRRCNEETRNAVAGLCPWNFTGYEHLVHAGVQAGELESVDWKRYLAAVVFGMM